MIGQVQGENFALIVVTAAGLQKSLEALQRLRKSSHRGGSDIGSHKPDCSGGFF